MTKIELKKTITQDVIASFGFDLALYATGSTHQERVTLVENNSPMFPKGIELNMSVDVYVDTESSCDIDFKSDTKTWGNQGSVQGSARKTRAQR